MRARMLAVILLGLASPALADAASRGRYDDMLAAIASFREIFDETARTRGPASAALLDGRRVAQLLAEADKLARQDKHDAALPLLDQAYALTETAVMRQRANETVVYDRSFRTVTDEIRYEARRHADYRALVAQAREQQSDQARRATIEQLAAEAEFERQEAEAAQAGGNLDEAVFRLGRANDILIKALNAAGLMTPG